MKHTIMTLWRFTSCLVGMTLIPFVAFNLAIEADADGYLSMGFLLKTTGFVSIASSLAAMWGAFWKADYYY